MGLDSQGLPPPRVNVPERDLEYLAINNGWRPTKRGWPDFICFNDKTGEVIAIEVKPRVRGKSNAMKSLARDQATCMDWLTSHGIRCFVSDGLTLEKYDRQVHRHGRKNHPDVLPSPPQT